MFHCIKPENACEKQFICSGKVPGALGTTPPFLQCTEPRGDRCGHVIAVCSLHDCLEKPQYNTADMYYITPCQSVKNMYALWSDAPFSLRSRHCNEWCGKSLSSFPARLILIRTFTTWIQLARVTNLKPVLLEVVRWLFELLMNFQINSSRYKAEGFMEILFRLNNRVWNHCCKRNKSLFCNLKPFFQRSI